MAFFDGFTSSLKQKWLHFFQANRSWITLHMEVESVYTPEGGKRPPSYLILGVVNVLEPKLPELMLPFAKLNPDADTLVEVLGLHFDPDMALGNHSIPESTAEHDSTLDESSDETLGGFGEESADETLTADADGFGEDAFNDHMDILDSHDETLTAPDHDSASGLGNFSFDHEEMSDGELLHGLDNSEAHESSLHETHPKAHNGTLDHHEGLDAPHAGFNVVMSDVWGYEPTLETGETEYDNLLGEDLGSDSDLEKDSEISRLFPSIEPSGK
jgi:Family of unknown function (DUF5331)